MGSELFNQFFVIRDDLNQVMTAGVLQFVFETQCIGTRLPVQERKEDLICPCCRQIQFFSSVLFC